MTGHVRDHHRFMLRQHLVEIDHLDGQIEGYDQRIEEVLSPLEQAACEKLDAIPGIDRKSAQCLLAEVGVNMDQFPSAAHLGVRHDTWMRGVYEEVRRGSDRLRFRGSAPDIPRSARRMPLVLRVLRCLGDLLRLRKNLRGAHRHRSHADLGGGRE